MLITTTTHVQIFLKLISQVLILVTMLMLRNNTDMNGFNSTNDWAFLALVLLYDIIPIPPTPGSMTGNGHIDFLNVT